MSALTRSSKGVALLAGRGGNGALRVSVAAAAVPLRRCRLLPARVSPSPSSSCSSSSSSHASRAGAVAAAAAVSQRSTTPKVAAVATAAAATLAVARRSSRGGTRAIKASAAAAAAAVAGPVAGQTLTQLLATIIGYCVLLGSCIRSVPQIIKIVQNKSVEGLSLAANGAELLAYSITFAYNWRLGYPLSTYGELLSCWAQDVILVSLLLFFRGVLGKRAVAAAAGYGLLLWCMLGGGSVLGLAVPGVSMELLTALQASTIFIVALGGRLPQIVLNARRGDSGQLSGATSALNLAGNAARVFTTVVLTGDFLNLVGALVQAVLNGTLLAQCVATARKSATKASDKKEDGGSASPVLGLAS